jgi:hypothetical protein
MRWATRPGCHVDRSACAWLIRRFLDPEAEFLFVGDSGDVPPGAVAFDIVGAELSHHAGNCSFETFLGHYQLTDPALHEIAEVVHDADLDDERFGAPEAPGLDVLIRGLSMTLSDEEVIEVTRSLFDGLYAFKQRSLTLGREPA